MFRRFRRLGGQRRWCGLVAAFDYDGAFERTKAAAMLRACDRIAHRGPDGRGFVAAQSKETRWALGHTRLAIVAPNEVAAAQPFHLATKNGSIDGVTSQTLDFVDSNSQQQKGIALAANGEIYTHQKLYRGLSSTPTSHSDCEVIAHLYASLGPAETMRRLEDAGMFAFVLIDAREEPKIFAARDPTGIKPLYYGVDRQSRVVAFASELKALVVVPEITHIQEFPNGHYFYNGEFQKYYNPEWQNKFYDDAADDHDVIFDALDRAVEKRMMTDVDFGLFLSGGVDSCIVGQLMTKRCRDLYGSSFRPPSFTVGMADSPDLMAARAMSKELGTNHTVPKSNILF